MTKHKTGSGMAGLFWFEKDYSTIRERSPGLTFSRTDLDNKHIVVYPQTHSRFNKDACAKYPRGRVDVFEGTVHLFVGTQCPPKAIDLVIQIFNLDEFRDAIEVTYDKNRDIGV